MECCSPSTSSCPKKNEKELWERFKREENCHFLRFLFAGTGVRCDRSCDYTAKMAAPGGQGQPIPITSLSLEQLSNLKQQFEEVRAQ
jgi:hypothetical protein